MKKDPLDMFTQTVETTADEIKPTSQEMIINELLSLKDLETKTDLDNSLVLALTKGAVFRDLFDNKLMGNLVKYVYLHRISFKRLGRTELKDMVKSYGSSFMEDHSTDSLFKRLVKGE
jgi:hypothetical protein